MNSRRTARVASVIREVVSTAILYELRDPRIENVTVTRVEVSGDIQHAKVYVSVMADERAQGLCMHGLESSAGFLQSKLADRIKTKYTPKLRFVLDEGVKNSFEVSRLIREVLPQGGGDTLADAEAEKAETSPGDDVESELTKDPESDVDSPEN
ncbi:MAG: 30S ribosome-binding factor RbfA [Planctomycetaceae bacterium]